jgi:hypothetical protein
MRFCGFLRRLLGFVVLTLPAEHNMCVWTQNTQSFHLGSLVGYWVLTRLLLLNNLPIDY